MQTPAQIHAKIDELLEDISPKLHAIVEHILAQGALNLEQASDNFHLPKLLYVTALRQLAEGYTPLPHDKASQRVLKHLSHF